MLTSGALAKIDPDSPVGQALAEIRQEYDKIANPGVSAVEREAHLQQLLFCRLALGTLNASLMKVGGYGSPRTKIGRAKTEMMGKILTGARKIQLLHRDALCGLGVRREGDDGDLRSYLERLAESAARRKPTTQEAEFSEVKP